MTPVKDMVLLDRNDLPAQAGETDSKPMELKSADTANLVKVIERMAKNKDVDIDKFERFMAMHERMLAAQARAAFFAAFADLQGDIPQITVLTGKVLSGPLAGGTYATNEDIQRVVRPVLQRHGFGLTFRTEFPTPTSVKIIGILGHKDGHAEQTEFISAADTTGSKNAIQALGSTIAYGIRYTTRALLNITSGEVDDDGAKAGDAPAPQEPKGYDNTITDLQAAADEGQKAFGAACKALAPGVLEYALKHDKAKMQGLKAIAQGVDRKAAQ